MPLDLILSIVHPIIQRLKLRVRTCPGGHAHGLCTTSYLAHPLLIRKQQCGHVSEDTGDLKHHGMFIKHMNVVIIYVRLDSHIGFLTLSAKRLAPTLSLAFYAVFCCPILEPWCWEPPRVGVFLRAAWPVNYLTNDIVPWGVFLHEPPGASRDMISAS